MCRKVHGNKVGRRKVDRDSVRQSEKREGKDTIKKPIHTKTYRRANKTKRRDCRKKDRNHYVCVRSEDQKWVVKFPLNKEKK